MPAPPAKCYNETRLPGVPFSLRRELPLNGRLAALRNPKAHLHLPDIDLQTVEESFLLWDPLRYLDTCPSSDGAMALVTNNYIAELGFGGFLGGGLLNPTGRGIEAGLGPGGQLFGPG